MCNKQAAHALLSQSNTRESLEGTAAAEDDEDDDDAGRRCREPSTFSRFLSVDCRDSEG